MASSTDAFEFNLTNLFSKPQNKGIIEMDLKFQKKSAKTSFDKLQLINLASGPGMLPYIEKDLHDHFQIQIFSSIYIGSNKQPFDLIFDTGSSWVWVGHDSCKNCANDAKFHSR